SHPALPSSPTRRSSDLHRNACRFGIDKEQSNAAAAALIAREARRYDEMVGDIAVQHQAFRAIENIAAAALLRRGGDIGEVVARRSEEHTSELQSRGQLV